MQKIDPLTCDLNAILAMTGYFEDETAPCGCEWDAYHRMDCPATPIWARMCLEGFEPYPLWPLYVGSAHVLPWWQVGTITCLDGSTQPVYCRPALDVVETAITDAMDFIREWFLP